ncbi:IS3 family transposase [Streptomyces sp. NPDC048155]|uniref:IS3 family transposase n=1 Tax=Streptomyces sp. NPDC048155 TaxID=3154818 RepID=UPI0033CE15EE
MNRCRFVEDHQRRYGVKRLCRILGIARSSFCHWRRSAPLRAARQAADAQLAARIRVIHRASDGTYGVPGITAELREDGERVNHKRVARIMQAIGLAGLRPRRKHRTTIPDPAAAKVPDLIGRNFTADEVNRKYVGDITYLPLTGGTFRYLATVIDLCSRRLAGWAIAVRGPAGAGPRATNHGRLRRNPPGLTAGARKGRSRPARSAPNAEVRRCVVSTKSARDR